VRSSQITIRDIALKLNISTSTVSRALRDVPEINPKTKQAVLDMAEQLHYQPNVIAQSLRQNKTHIIGVVVPEISIHFFSTAISGIQDKATEYGYNIMICQSNENFETEESALRALTSTRVDGLLISLTRETVDLKYLKEISEHKLPIVLFDRVVDDLPVSQVTVDDHDGAFQAVAHLFANGCRRIAHLAGPSTLSISHKRKQGYLDALEVFNLEKSEDLVVNCPALKDSAKAATQRLLDLDTPPDAIFAINDPVAIIAASVLKDKGFKIPEDVALVGFTNEPIGAHMSPSLTTVSQPAYEIGQVAMELFLEQMNYPGLFKPKNRVLKTKLLVRDSSRRNSRTVSKS
jgi:LacI family transcriptional regulator